ncbi:hypothetical protein KDA23_01760 [Candidatus Saccharibacteria bacterium]|nr:hypothetical protein [Candidatus Saccharibacteria bacterium]
MSETAGQEIDFTPPTFDTTATPSGALTDPGMPDEPVDPATVARLESLRVAFHGLQ